MGEVGRTRGRCMYALLIAWGVVTQWRIGIGIGADWGGIEILTSRIGVGRGLAPVGD